MQLTRNDLILERALIGGSWVAEGAGRSFPVTNPANGACLAHVPDCGAAEGRAAVERAQAAFPAWRALPGKERARLLGRWFQALLANREDLARLLSLEQGKPLREALGEVDYGASYVEWFAEEAKRVYGDIIPATVKGRRVLVVKEPVGVVAAITPWNFPIAMLARKIAPALAVGCTVVAKPAEDTPLSALAIAKLAEETGIPAGVINIVTASRDRAAEVAGAWLDDARVRKLTFTGSTQVGKRLANAATGTLKRVSLELGGNAPFIVFDDADLDAAVAGVMASKFRNTGQTCVCANRILVQSGVYAEFAAKLAPAVAALRVGPAASGDTDQGPLINARAADKVEEHIRDAVGRGAKILVGGRRHDLGGTFFQPTVLTEVTAAMRVATEETFGPVAPLFRFESEADAVALANATPFGLAAYFYSRDIARIWRVAEALEVGIVGINEGIISSEVAPFGGIKESGYGREGSHYGLDDYLNIKYLCMGGLAA
ncbi:MAG TPA: NAD-dependent succinate-semialdehyde dehydrogenase [Steroidobacteraceae bacterium]|nr:NAD-dependent succinate-semialdehyde dehydrogenase [Steroidobacteraceae bacterium]